jgi:hypothetical protein
MMKDSNSGVKSCQVIDKIKPIFICEHLEGTVTEKANRSGQKYLATSILNPDVQTLLESGTLYKVTAKVDGTSCIVRDSELLKRRDQKIDKRTGSKKTMPDKWILTGESTEVHGVGYMPIEQGDKWYLDVFDSDNQRVRVLQIKDRVICSEYVKLKDLNNHSYELIGPKIQSDPHSLGFHALIEHGLIELNNFPDIGNHDPSDNLLDRIKEWILTDPVGQSVEGVVIHFENGVMFKLHKHHLGMEWNSDGTHPLLDIVIN